jgi:plasmid stabilization system protein ParE
VFHVTIEGEAKDNLREHYRRLKARSPGSPYPSTWYYGIRAAIRDLAISAERCGLAYEDRYFAEVIRQRLYDSYKILFTIRGRQVHVLHIRHQAQDPEDVVG